MLPTEAVSFSRPFSRSKFLEFLRIDDNIGVELLSKSAHRALAPARDTVVCKQSGVACERFGLIRRPEKQKRGATSGTFLGADLDGVEGFVSAPRDRILMLCAAEVCRRGSCTPKLLSVLSGCWIHVVMFRRPALCVLDSAFANAAVAPADRVTRRPQPCCRTEQRRYYALLEAPASAALRELGEKSVVERAWEIFWLTTVLSLLLCRKAFFFIDSKSAGAQGHGLALTLLQVLWPTTGLMLGVLGLGTLTKPGAKCSTSS